MMSVTDIREVVERDVGFLAAMLAEAVAWRPDAAKLSAEEVLPSPAFGRYVAGWPRAGDAGAIAEDGSAPVGAAWYRLFDSAEHGYGFVADDVPEVTIGVVERFRGRGIGRALLRTLTRRARTDGHRALSLSVEPANFARHLYESEGFVEVGRVGDSLTMLVQLTPL